MQPVGFQHVIPAVKSQMNFIGNNLYLQASGFSDLLNDIADQTILDLYIYY